MQRLLIGATMLAAAALAGCNVTQNQIDTARAGYDAAFLTPAAHYRQLGYCATGTVATIAHPCADRALVKKLQADDAAVHTALVNAQAAVTAGNAGAATIALQVLQTAVAVAEADVANLPVPN